MKTENILVAAAGFAFGAMILKGDKVSGVSGDKKRISKNDIKARLYKPTGDFFIENNGKYWLVHFTPKDAVTNHSNLSRLNAIAAGNGYYGAAYNVPKKG